MDHPPFPLSSSIYLLSIHSLLGHLTNHLQRARAILGGTEMAHFHGSSSPMHSHYTCPQTLSPAFSLPNGISHAKPIKEGVNLSRKECQGCSETRRPCRPHVFNLSGSIVAMDSADRRLRPVDTVLSHYVSTLKA